MLRLQRARISWRRARGVYPKDPRKFRCKHQPAGANVKVRVLNHPRIIRESGACQECLERYLNDCAFLCVKCGNPIIPLDEVGIHHLTGSYVHYQSKCGAKEERAGVWGSGVLIPDEKDKFPRPIGRGRPLVG